MKSLKKLETMLKYQKTEKKNKYYQMSEFLELSRCIYYIHMAHQLLPATVPFKAQIVQNLLQRLSFSPSGIKLLPEMSYRLSTAPASYRDNHCFSPLILKNSRKVSISAKNTANTGSLPV